MDFLRKISSFKSNAVSESSEHEVALSQTAADELKGMDSEFILESILGFVSRHYSHVLLLSSSFSILFTLYSIFSTIRFLYKGRKFRAGTQEYFELLKSVHSAAQDEKYDGNRDCENILLQYPEMMNSSMLPYEFTPFLRACWTGNTDLIKFMIDQGADVTKRTINGDNGFFLAAYKQSKMKKEDWDSQVLETLLDAGLDVNDQNLRGHTALHVAAKEGHALLTQWLLDHGANPDSGKGPHPLQIAHSFKDNEHREVALLLAKHSFRPLQDFEDTVEFTEGQGGKHLPSFFFQPDFLL